MASLARLEMSRPFLSGDLLGAVRQDLDNAAARVGGPQRAVALGQNAFGPLQIVANVAECGFVDFEIENRIASAQG